jgi:hypothetical protein
MPRVRCHVFVKRCKPGDRRPPALSRCAAPGLSLKLGPGKPKSRRAETFKLSAASLLIERVVDIVGTTTTRPSGRW